MRTYIRNRHCLVFSRATGDTAEFKEIAVVEHADAMSFHMRVKVPNTDKTFVPVDQNKWVEAMEEAAGMILFTRTHFMDASQLQATPVWEDMKDEARVYADPKVPLLLKSQRDKALQALPEGQNILALRRA